MGRSCVCGGSNENCRFCNGSGVVPDRLDSVVGRPVNKFEPGGVGNTKSHIERRESQVGRPSLVLCPKGCKLLIKSDALAGHLARVHKAKPGSPKASSSAYTHCSFCNTKLRKDELQKHQVKWHADKLNLPVTAAIQSQTNQKPYTPNHAPNLAAKAPQNAQTLTGASNLRDSIKAATKNQIVIPLPSHNQVAKKQISQTPANARLSCVPCPRCAAPVRADRIQRHMLKVHKTSFAVVPGIPAKVVESSSSMVTCPNCLARLRPERLERHIGWVHSGRRKKRKKSKKGKTCEKREPRLVSGGLPGLGKRR
jgi:hypothetical protein